MTLQELGSLGEAVSGLAVIVSLVYLAMQIRQNTVALRSASYHQAAEQTWSALLAATHDQALAEAWFGDLPGYAPEHARIIALDTSVLYGFENMLRIKEEGMVDADVWENVITNSLAYLKSPRVQQLLRNRRGPLSQRLLQEVERRPAPPPPTPLP
jgi:hypothetical protein